jgi:glyoxylase I family protein
MALINSSGYAHVRITVTQIERSKAFYEMVFGWPVVIDNSARVDEPGVKESADDFYGGTVFQTPSGALLGLRPVAPNGQKFDSEHVGLDHLSFLVDSREDLVVAEQRLADADIEHGQIIDLTGAGLAVLSFQDPDGINIELSALLS